MDWPFRITEYHGLSLAITPTADWRASLLMSKLLRDRIIILGALLDSVFEDLKFAVDYHLRRVILHRDVGGNRMKSRIINRV